MPRPIDADALIGRSVPLEGLDGSGIPYVVRAVPVMFIDDTPTLDYKDLVPQGEWEDVGLYDYRCKGLHRLDMGYLNRGLYQIVAKEVDFLRVALYALKEQRMKGSD